MQLTDSNVPDGDPVEGLVALLRHCRRWAVLTGAGCSTNSGIPDYRDGAGAWKRPPPMHYAEFTASHAARQRYWARALVGWRQFRRVEPNDAHHVLARLEQRDRLAGLITQNVDGLHQRAGSRNVVDLHGRIDTVECLDCRARSPRDRLQAEMAALNPGWAELQAQIAPDGDASLQVDFSSFRVPPCALCGGVLKPAVVFFGEAVPRETVARCYQAVESADALLVVGSSLMVYSGYRFARAARAAGIPTAIVNLGRTRADDEVELKIEADCGAVMTALEAHLFLADQSPDARDRRPGRAP